jgi:hypothetical protein
MFLRRLFYACAAILCLVLTFHFGYGAAMADFNGSTSGRIKGFIPGGGSGVVITETGEVLRFSPDGWSTTNPAPPVPVSQIAFWSPDVLVTVSDEGWIFVSATQQWVSLGPPPGGAPTTIQMETWGGIKTKFKK